MDKLNVTIRCTYYSEEAVVKCLGFKEGIKFPSKKEIMEFCLSGNFKSCPVYQQKKEGGGQR
ncbi:MAG: hypothetical protein HZA77_12275 [Candidatus Schekmanbacteria bacterium]|nr:hypothetical protein [Candidatus Schekmanbacteria bacterium]